MRRAPLALVLVLLAAGCGSGSTTPSTRLTLSALNPSVGMAVFHLDCSPSGGDVPDAAAACAVLRRDPALVRSPQPYTCIGGPWSWFDMTISGRLAGKPVREKFSTCWTPQMPTLGKLGLFKALQRHIRPPRHGNVPAGQTMTFPPGALRPGDLLTCHIRGHHLELGIVDRVGSMGSNGFGGKDVVSVTLTATRHSDGAITTRCYQGKP